MLFVVLVLACGAVAWMGHSLVNARPCQAALSDLGELHPVVFGAMAMAGAPVFTRCAGASGVNPITGARQVEAIWTYRGQSYTAVYEDSPLGVLSPANATAVALDKAASSGASAVRALLGGW